VLEEGDGGSSTCGSVAAAGWPFAGAGLRTLTPGLCCNLKSFC
jgi:hypothetical protein